jgi:hypothetical protein
MPKPLPRLSDLPMFIAFVSVAVSGCGSGTAPTRDAAARYDGQWTGTTFQGRSISFNVSADQKVTAITR